MKREIKFRALLTKGDNSGKWWEYYTTLTQPAWLDFTDVEITVKDLEFTGLKDKNGKEIWEGDFIHGKIVRLSETIIIKGYIEYALGLAKFRVKYKSPRGWDLHMDLSVFHEIEIIGNQLENPELLK